MSDSDRIRLCERCWRPLTVGTVFRVFRHPARVEPAGGSAGPDVEALSYRHLDGDPACTGAQTEERAA